MFKTFKIKSNSIASIILYFVSNDAVIIFFF